MTDNNRRWAALVKVMGLPPEVEKKDNFTAELTITFPIKREMFEKYGSKVTLLALKDCMIDGIDDAIKKIREAIK